MEAYITAGGAWESMDLKGSEFGTIVEPCPYDEPVPVLSSMQSSQIQVHRGRIEGHLGAYNKKDQKIHIAEELVYEAVDEQLENDASEKLFMLLLEEYGHYIDDLLRNEYYGKVGGDAKDDKGAVFAYRFVTFALLPRLHFAEVISKKYCGVLDINYTELHQAAKNIQALKSKHKMIKKGIGSFLGQGMVILLTIIHWHIV